MFSNDYFIAINKTSCINNKTIYIPNSLLNYYYYFNDLSKKCNEKMKMNYGEKPMTLLGKFKLDFNENQIIFTSDTKKIIIIGKFIMENNKIYYYKKSASNIKIVCQSL